VDPLNYGKGAMICGRKYCMNDGVIWLTQDELSLYQNGTRIFFFDSAVCKVKVK
jgi:hypothetical protein